MPGNSIREQRLYARVTFQDPVRANPVLHPEHSWYLLAEDLSAGGLMLLAPEMFAVGLRLVLDIEPNQVSEPIHCVGQVVWAARAGHQEGYRLGIEFVDVGDATSERLRELVADRAQAGEG